MHDWWLTAVGVGASIAVALLWQLAMAAILRALGIRLPFSLPFQFYTRKAPELVPVQEEWTEGTYVLIFGFLLLACPWFAGLVAYDYIARIYIEHSAYSANSLVGLAVVFLMLVVCGRWRSVNNWKKLRVSSMR